MAGSAARSNPQRSPAGRKRSKTAIPRQGARPTILGRVFARPGVIVAGATFAAVMTSVVANALLFQRGHHPSPLFTPAPVVTQPAPADAPAPVQAPVQRQVIEAPAPVDTEPQPAPPPPPAAPAAAQGKPAHVAAKPAGKVVHKPAAPHRDLIGELLSKQGN